MTPEEYLAAHVAMLADHDFMVWLKAENPDWASEYSSSNLAMHAAWLAGRKAERDEDRLNSDLE